MQSMIPTNGISLIQVAEGALNETYNILQRINELAVQATNDTNTTIDRQALQDEINSLASEVDRISKQTNFNSDIYPLDACEAVLPDGIRAATTHDTNHLGGPVSVNGRNTSSYEVLEQPDGTIAYLDKSLINSSNFNLMRPPFSWL